MLIDYLKDQAGKGIVVVAPDAGRVKVAERYSQRLGARLAFVNKYRPKGQGPDTVMTRDVIGEVEGRRCVVIDDRIDTGGTIAAAADILMKHGATDVSAMATHAVLADPAIDRLKTSLTARVVVTDTVPIPSEKQIDKLEVLSVAKVIADANDRLRGHQRQRVFGGESSPPPFSRWSALVLAAEDLADRRCPRTRRRWRRR